MEEDELAEARPPSPPPAKQSPMGLVVALLVVTVAGVGAGSALSLMQIDKIANFANKAAESAPDKADMSLAWDQSAAVLRLEPVITNLASPSGVWIRIKTAVVIDHERIGDVSHMRASLSEDIMMFLRTVSLNELNGPSALNHLRDDLNERVRVASDGAVREIIIENMVIQ